MSGESTGVKRGRPTKSKYGRSTKFSVRSSYFIFFHREWPFNVCFLSLEGFETKFMIKQL